MYRDLLGEYFPEALGLGSKVKFTINSAVSASNTHVPPLEGLEYAKHPANNENTEERRRDLFFFGQLFALVGSSEFVRGDLDAGRLNRLWCDGSLVEVDDQELRCSKAKRFRLCASTAAIRFESVQNVQIEQ